MNRNTKILDFYEFIKIESLVKSHKISNRWLS